MAALPAIAAGVSLAATGIQAISSIKQGEAGAEAAEFNARTAEENAILEARKGAEDERQFRISAAKELGDIRAGYAASGVASEGSALDVLEESAKNMELDAQKIKYNSATKVRALNQEAKLSRMRGASSITSGYLGAAGSALKGTAEFGSYLSNMSGSTDNKLKYKPN